MEVIILAGGLGTRLKGVTSGLIPKPMVDVCGKPFLEHIVNVLSEYDITSVVLSVGFKHEIIQNYFQDSWKGIPIKYSIEEELLGTGGAIRLALDYTTDDDVCVLNGDTLFKINFDEFFRNHVSKSSIFTMALKEMKNFNRYGTVLTTDGRISRFKEKQFCEVGLINAGVYCINKQLAEYFPNKNRFSFEKELLEKQCDNLEINYSVYNDYFIDIGIPEDYLKAQTDLT